MAHKHSHRYAAAVLAACLAAMTCPPSAGGQTPQTLHQLDLRYIGPPGNRVNAVAGVPGDPNVIYAGTPSGGVFKTNDAGLHWRPIFDTQMVESIGSIAVARTDPNTVWVGTGDPFIRPNLESGDGVYKSTDAGRTWQHMGLDASGRIGRVAIDPTNANVVFVAAMGHSYGPQQERGVFRTTDGGKTWTRVLFVDENTGAIDVAIDPVHPRVVFAATWQLVIHPWTSEDGGAGSGIYVSHDGGTTWTHLTGHGLPEPPLGKIALAIAPSDPNRIYALIETANQGNLWRSDDGGGEWTRASRDPNLNRRARYFSKMGVLPDNPNDVYFLTQSVYLSHDGGATNAEVAGLFPDHHDIWIDPVDGRRIIIANDRYVNISHDRGASWFHVDLPDAQINRVAVDRRMPYDVYGSRQDGPVFYGPSNSLLASTGGGGGGGSTADGTGQLPEDMWMWGGGAESGWAIPDPADPDIIWYSGSNNVSRFDTRTRISGTTNPFGGRGGGRGAEPGAPGAGAEPARGGGGGGGGFGRGGADTREYRTNWSVPIATSPFNPHALYAGSQYVHMTADDGKTWTKISPDLTRNDKEKEKAPGDLGPDGQDVPCSLYSIAVSPIEDGVIWAGSNDGLVHVTRDGGKTWSDATAAMPNLESWGNVTSIQASHFVKGGAYVTVDRHRAADDDPHIYRTTDYGHTWSEIDGGIPKSRFSYARVIRDDPVRRGLLYLGTENSLYVSLDDGASWINAQNNLPHVPINWMEVQPDFDDLVIATWGRGFWIMDDVTPLQQLTPAVLASDRYLFQPRSAYLFHLRDATTARSFDAEFDAPANMGHNPLYGASIDYYLKAAADSVRLVVLDAKGDSVQTLKGPADAGVDRVWWDLRGAVRTAGAAAAGRGGGGVGAGGPAGAGGRGRGGVSPQVEPGVYTIRLLSDGASLETKLTVLKDPNE